MDLPNLPPPSGVICNLFYTGRSLSSLELHGEPDYSLPHKMGLSLPNSVPVHSVCDVIIPFDNCEMGCQSFRRH